jgi:Tfp pilus assembly protein FimT
MLQQRRQVVRLRPALTLLEILLALSVIVALAAIAIPVLQGPLAVARLKGGAQQLQSLLGQARLLAMSSGENCIVRYVIGSNEYALEPWSAIDPTLATDDSLLDPMQVLTNSQQRTLPPDVVFAQHDIEADVRSTTSSMMFDERQQQQATAAAESRLFFYPDGTSSTARVILANKDGRLIAVMLRGLTGMARIEEVQSQEALR